MLLLSLLCWIQDCGDLGFYEKNIFYIIIYLHLAVCGSLYHYLCSCKRHNSYQVFCHVSQG